MINEIEYCKASKASKASNASKEEKAFIIYLIHQLKTTSTRERALLELAKKKETFSNLALYIWFTPGIIAIFLQEITSCYKLLAPPILNERASNKICNILGLFQTIASHSETTISFLSSHMPIYLFPFLNTMTKNKVYEYLRLASLGVIGALIRTERKEVISFFLNTEIIILCLRIADRGVKCLRQLLFLLFKKLY